MSIATSFSNHSPMWFTPPEWLEWVTSTLGPGWYDPCPTDFDVSGDQDGLTDPWLWPFYCNHPGSRGSSAPWWTRFISEQQAGKHGIWCAFNCEQLRHMRPSPFHRPGWLVMPEDRVGFIWGGPDIITNEAAVAKGSEPKWRRHGERCKSPGNWTVFWSSTEPAPTPDPSVIVRTGFGEAEVAEARYWAKHWRQRALAAEALAA